MKTNIMNRVNGILNKTGLKVKKYSPEILVVAGVIGVATSAVMACRATLKVNEVMDKSKDDIDRIHKATENGVTDAGESYSEEDSKKDLTTVYIQTGFKLAKLYAPSVALGALSIASIITSNNIHRKRNVALAAAYATVDKSFKEYRGRVIERFGKEIDHELKYNIKAKEVSEVVIGEDGKEETVIKTVNIIDPNVHSEFARVFDKTNPGWESDSDYTLMYLRARQNYANDLLKARGHLFLNEVYDLLDIERVPEGQIVGWIYDPENPKIDSYVDFGIYEAYKDSEDLLDEDKIYVLDFNVDGNMFDLINR